MKKYIKYSSRYFEMLCLESLTSSRDSLFKVVFSSAFIAACWKEGVEGSWVFAFSRYSEFLGMECSTSSKGSLFKVMFSPTVIVTWQKEGVEGRRVFASSRYFGSKILGLESLTWVSTSSRYFESKILGLECNLLKRFIV